MPRVKRQKGGAARPSWSRPAKVVVSLFILLHLTAVFLPPFTLMTAPVRGIGSPLSEFMMSSMSWYIDAAYLNHGYAFFAPDPGPSHLLRAELTYADGREPEEIVMPDLKRHWPRLLYHRHFMLSEHLNSAFVPPEPPPEIMEFPMELAGWRQARAIYEARRSAIINHLQSLHGAESVKLTRLEHQLLSPYEFLEEGKPIDGPDTYVELNEGPLPPRLP